MLNNQGERRAQPGLKGDSILVEGLRKVWFFLSRIKRRSKTRLRRGKNRKISPSITCFELKIKQK